MSVSVPYAFTISTVETLASNTDSAPDATRKVTHTNFNEAGTLTSVSTPPATTQASFVKALSTGTATVDLTSLPGSNGATISGSGLRVQLLRVKNLGANALTISSGASNGYEQLGADFSITLPQNGVFQVLCNDAGSDIGGSYKIFDLSGTGSQTSEWTIVMG